MKSRTLCLVCLLAELLEATAVESSSAVLTNVAQIRALLPEQAAQQLPVQVRGVLTFIDPEFHVAFVRDETGSSYFSPRLTPQSPAVKCVAGDLIELTGVTSPGRFAPQIVNGSNAALRVRVLGHPGLPEPRRLAPQELANPVNHSEWIEVVGTVREVKREKSKTRLDLSTSSGGFSTLLPLKWTERGAATNWLGAVLRLRGVHGSVFTEGKELTGLRVFVPRMEDVHEEDAGVASFDDRPLRTADTLLRFTAQTSPRLRVAGVVTYSEPGRGVFLRGATGSLWVQSPQREHLPPGTELDAIGFPGSADGRAVLRDAFLRASGHQDQLEPRSVSVEDAFAGRLHGELVSLRGEVIDRFIQPGNHILLLKSGERLFHARLAQADRTNTIELPPRGSVTEVSGICVNDFVPNPGRLSDEATRYLPVALQIAMRSPDDIRMLQAPPYWTTERMRWLALGATVVLLLAVAWIALLRRQVGRQTAVIQEKVARETLQEERVRIARELHDTLEQELTGLSLQLDAATDTLPESPETAQRALVNAQALLKHTRSEARRSIWDLRASALENGDLVTALRETLHQFTGGNGGPEIVVESDGGARRLPGRIENNLLRIASEAVTNAVKHARARRIVVRVEFGADSVRLCVGDDGRGFDTEAAMSLGKGHYGLLGIRERAEKMGGELELRGGPGRGTEIAVRVKACDTELAAA